MKKFLASLVLVVSLVALVAPAFAKCEFGYTYRINPNCEKCGSQDYFIYAGSSTYAVCKQCRDTSDNIVSDPHF
ncbi:MAG: hypothetical protein Q4C78_00125 [Synergistaceae bacterium]|nr:hypothetical protein [Synergistaceae bacterium]